MKHRLINFILFITFAAQAAELFIKKPRYIALLDAPDRRRQVAQPAQPTLPSNYWWPYPSLTWGGGGTSTASATVPATTVASVSSPTVSSDSISTSASDISSSSTTLTTSSSSVSDLSTTAIDAQQTNLASHSHVSRLSIPIIASIAGVVGICVLILLLCRCCTRRRREYVTRHTSQRRRDRGDAEKGWRRISIDNWEENQQQRSWWTRMFSTRSEEVEDVVPGPRYIGVDDEVERSLILGRDDVNRARGQLQDELLLAERPRRSTRRPNHSLSSHQSLMSSRSMSISTTALCALAEQDNVQVEDEEYEESKQDCDIPWESLRHKSIKRAILAKVDKEKKWTDSMRGVRAANANAANVGRRQTHVRCDSDFWVDAGGGFRIVAESPPQIPTPQGKTWTSLASSFPFLSSGADEESEDRYTPAPARMGNSSKSRSRRGSVTSPMRVVEKRAGASQNFLRSPPTVTSPQMESALCFTPVLSPSKGDWTSFGHSEYVENADNDHNDNRFRDSGATSFPPGQERMQGQQRNGDTAAPGTAFTKTYRLRTDRALKHVEAIVESGWTERGVATRIIKDTITAV